MKNNNVINNIKELKKTNMGKSILFFGFYFVFFILIIIFIKTAPRNIISPDEYEKSRPTTFDFSVLTDSNYHFKYTIYLDDYKYFYEGDKLNELELFNYNNSDYFNNNDTFYRKDSSWIKVDNPYRFNKLLKNKNIENLIKSSYYVDAKIEENDIASYELSISSNTINKVIDNKDTDIEENPNMIIVYASKEGKINKISYKLDSYCKSIEGCQNTLIIDLEYSNVGNIKEIKNPIN